MELLPIHTPILKEDDDLAGLIADAGVEEGDIVAVSSKAAAVIEGSVIDLNKLDVSDEAKEWSDKLNRTEPNPAFRQAILDEVKRRNGKVLPSCPHAMLTEITPDELEEGSLLLPNAGLDQSNIQEGYAIGWPRDPLASAAHLRREIAHRSGKRIAAMLTDSGCRPRRIGVTAIALTVSGFDPLEDQRGKADLFGRDLRMTQEARADQLATAANFLMGNADESIPAVIIRGHGLTINDFEGWVPCINAEDDLFRGVL